jgi:hypothetical protein
MFLPARAQDLLFERIHTLCARGSRIAVEAISNDFLKSDRLARQREQMQRVRAAAAKLSSTEIPDFEQLWYLDERSDVADWLRRHGWHADVQTAAELMDSHQRGVPDELEDRDAGGPVRHREAAVLAVTAPAHDLLRAREAVPTAVTAGFVRQSLAGPAGMRRIRHCRSAHWPVSAISTPASPATGAIICDNSVNIR